MEARRRRRALTFVVGLAISALFVWLTVRQVDLGRVWMEMRGASLAILSIALFTRGIQFVFAAFRTRVLFAPHHPIDLRLSLKSVLVGFVGNNVLPFRLGELLRVAYLARVTPASAESSLAVVALERIVDTFCLLVILAIAVAVTTLNVEDDARIFVMTAVVVVGLGGAVAIAKHPDFAMRVVRWAASILGQRISEAITVRAERFTEGIAALASGRLLSRVLALSFALWVSALVTLWIVATSLGIHVGWHMPIIVLVFVAFGTMLPNSPGFVGTYHYFATSALVFLEVEREPAAAFATVAHVMAIVPYTLVSLPFLLPHLTRTLGGDEVGTSSRDRRSV